jgi:signal transduction histidine kinase
MPLLKDEIGSLARAAEVMRLALRDTRQERDHREQDLRDSQEERARQRDTLESILASMGEGLVVADAQGRVNYCNPAVERLLGLKASRVVGQPLDRVTDFLASRVADPQEWRRAWAKALERAAEGATISFQLWLPQRMELGVTLFAIVCQGERLGTGLLLHDVTREREADRMKMEFISMASHELRSPTAVVHGFAELLFNSQELPEEQREWVARIYQGSQRLTDIISDLLDISRIEMGRLSLRLEPVALEPLISRLIDQISPVYSSHLLHVHTDQGLPPVQADTAKLTQVLRNLIDNAVKYSPQGEPVGVSARWDAREGRVIISVADRGLGIPEEEMPRLFTRFHRIQRPETESLRGTGLGLYIVKSLVEMMGGWVGAESKLNEGSTFYISLPPAEVPPQD